MLSENLETHQSWLANVKKQTVILKSSDVQGRPNPRAESGPENIDRAGPIFRKIYRILHFKVIDMQNNLFDWIEYAKS